MSINKQSKYYLIGLLVFLLFSITRTDYWYKWQDYLRPMIEQPLTVSYAWGQELDTEDVEDPALVEAMSQSAQIFMLRRENDELRRELGLKANQVFTDVVVELIGRRQDEIAVTYLVNRGSESGVRPGLAVISQGVLVGTVIRVTATNSEIVLLTSPLNAVTAEIQNTSTSRGVAQGEFNLAVKMKYIPAGDEISAGDSVITSGLDELIPRGLLVGTVASVEFKEGEFFKAAVVVPPFDITKVSFLKIILR